MLLSKGMLLFTAPMDFDPAVWDAYVEFNPAAETVALNPYAVTMAVCSPAENRFIGDEWFDAFPNLHILATASTGTNHIDLDACAARGIKVLSLLDDRDGLNTISASAEWTFKLILEGLRLKRPYHELQGRQVCCVGYGRIGGYVVDWCRAFGAAADYYDPAVTHQQQPTLVEVFEMYNVVVISCALTDETRGMITYDLLRRLRFEAVLVNTARGEIINEPDLCRFMAERPDVRVCLDVVTGEVNGTANPERLRQLGAYVTPHIAGESYESRTKAARIILELLKKEMVSA